MAPLDQLVEHQFRILKVTSSIRAGSILYQIPEEGKSYEAFSAVYPPRCHRVHAFTYSWMRLAGIDQLIHSHSPSSSLGGGIATIAVTSGMKAYNLIIKSALPGEIKSVTMDEPFRSGKNHSVLLKDLTECAIMMKKRDVRTMANSGIGHYVHCVDVWDRKRS